MQLVSPGASHTHRGVTDGPGETFEGGEQLLAAFGDRLSAAPEPEASNCGKPTRAAKIAATNAEAEDNADTAGSQ
ncbi:hydroxyacylglutathione hydrolase [Rhodovulum sulfidophilum]|uniref:Hydroxyacylglutathione hydrolase n=1 Tax=Rhodovulum sulfidophilum TaxID=35806 RepID=A0A0D6B918_RHOSU|nr:hydroxyacylglutathione hydrolase [Rhodovulum sulfidophilum]BAQ71249.1 hydroxyacylglutathione hydrolase [Rhodovulum sulfidophilum]